MKLMQLFEVESNPRAGKCFELAAKYCMKNGGLYTIAQVTVGGKLFNHAFVIQGDSVYDPEHDRMFKKSEYDSSFSPKILKQLNQTEVLVFILKKKSFPYPEQLGLK